MAAFTNIDIFVLLSEIYCTCHVTDSVRTVAGLCHCGPSVWNSLPDPVRIPNSTEAAFKRLIKT